jgi:hypothetical protein
MRARLLTATVVGILCGAIAAGLVYVLAYKDRNDLDDILLLAGIVVVVGLVVGVGTYALTRDDL